LGRTMAGEVPPKYPNVSAKGLIVVLIAKQGREIIDKRVELG